MTDTEWERTLPPYITAGVLDGILSRALAEDIGQGDLIDHQVESILNFTQVLDHLDGFQSGIGHQSGFSLERRGVIECFLQQRDEFIDDFSLFHDLRGILH